MKIIASRIHLHDSPGVIELGHVDTKPDGTSIFGAAIKTAPTAGDTGNRVRVHAAPKQPIVGLDALLGALANGD